MKVISIDDWVEGPQYLPVARIEKPISYFCAQFNCATAPLKSGTPGIRFLSKDGQLILREVPGTQYTELLVPTIDAENVSLSDRKIEDSFVAAMKNIGLGLGLPHLSDFHKALKAERIQARMGYGLKAQATMNSKPSDP
jgi:hypothetical protein